MVYISRTASRDERRGSRSPDRSTGWSVHESHEATLDEGAVSKRGGAVALPGAAPRLLGLLPADPARTTLRWHRPRIRVLPEFTGGLQAPGLRLRGPPGYAGRDDRLG